jgi:hypothetical protein
LVGGSDPNTPLPCPYSRAFDNIVQDDDDVVGLLAYALYKRAIREEAQQGQKSNGDSRNPSRTVVETYRQAAERTLASVIDASMEAAKPELQVSAALDAIESSRLDLREHVTQRTSFIPALITNVVAWAFTLLITVLILLAFNRPDPAQTLKTITEEAVGSQNSN